MGSKRGQMISKIRDNLTSVDATYEVGAIDGQSAYAKCKIAGRDFELNFFIPRDEREMKLQIDYILLQRDYWRKNVEEMR